MGAAQSSFLSGIHFFKCEFGVSRAIYLQGEGCSHLEEVQDEMKDVLRRYKTVVSWHFNRTNEALHQVKRRKVCVLSLIELAGAKL